MKEIIESIDKTIDFMNNVALQQAKKFDVSKNSEDLKKFIEIEQANNTLKDIRKNIISGLTKKAYK